MGAPSEWLRVAGFGDRLAVKTMGNHEGLVSYSCQHDAGLEEGVGVTDTPGVHRAALASWEPYISVVSNSTCTDFLGFLPPDTPPALADEGRFLSSSPMSLFYPHTSCFFLSR